MVYLGPVEIQPLPLSTYTGDVVEAVLQLRHVQHCSNTSTSAMELLQFCTKSSIYQYQPFFYVNTFIAFVRLYATGDIGTTVLLLSHKFFLNLT